MKKFALLLPILALAACGGEPTPKPTPTQTVAAAPTEPALPAPTKDVFAAAFAKACPSAEKVGHAICKRAGMGSDKVLCDYGLGDDEYMRNSATLTPGDGEWTLADPETTCAKGA